MLALIPPPPPTMTRSAATPFLAACLLAGAGLLAGCTTRSEPGNEENATVTDSQPASPSAAAGVAQGEWRDLFDGRTLAGWRSFRSDTPPAGWTVQDGMLARTGSGGDIMTVDQFANFELSLDWRVAPAGNSGIIYRITSEGDETYMTGPEMQVLDDAGHADGRSRLTAAGSVYGLYPAPEGVVRPANEWNTARLLVNGNHVEHWLNDQKVAEYELLSEDWERRVRESKFAEWPLYGRAPRGHIALQDHGDLVHYRNIRIRELP